MASAFSSGSAGFEVPGGSGYREDEIGEGDKGWEPEHFPWTSCLMSLSLGVRICTEGMRPVFWLCSR